MRIGDGTIDSITKTIHIHPALSEVIIRAAEKFDQMRVEYIRMENIYNNRLCIILKNNTFDKFFTNKIYRYIVNNIVIKMLVFATFLISILYILQIGSSSC